MWFFTAPAYSIYSLPLAFALLLCFLDRLLGLRNYIGVDIQCGELTDLQPSLFAKFAAFFRLQPASGLESLALFLMLFGLTGLGAQKISFSQSNSYLSQSLLLPIAVCLSLLLTAVLLRLFKESLPCTRTAKTVEDFSGHIAIINTCNIDTENYNRATLLNRCAQQVEVEVKALESNQHFVVGDKVVLVKGVKDRWLATRYQSSSAAAPDADVSECGLYRLR